MEAQQKAPPESLEGGGPAESSPREPGGWRPSRKLPQRVWREEAQQRASRRRGALSPANSHLHGEDVQQLAGVLDELKVVLEDAHGATQSLVAAAAEQGHAHVEQDGGDEGGPGQAAHTALTALLTAWRTGAQTHRQITVLKQQLIGGTVEWTESGDALHRRVLQGSPPLCGEHPLRSEMFLCCLQSFMLVIRTIKTKFMVMSAIAN